MPQEKDGEEDAEVIPFPVPRTPPPANPEPPCTCSLRGDTASCPRHGS